MNYAIITPEQAMQALENDIAKAHERYQARLKSLEDRRKKNEEILNRAKNHHPDLNIYGRFLKALNLRRSGKTFKSIGIELGVSAGRAQQIVRKAERLEKSGDLDQPQILSTRAQNALLNATGCIENVTPEYVSLNITEQQMLSQDNVGKDTVFLIRAWLVQNGFDFKNE